MLYCLCHVFVDTNVYNLIVLQVPTLKDIGYLTSVYNVYPKDICVCDCLCLCVRARVPEYP